MSESATQPLEPPRNGCPPGRGTVQTASGAKIGNPPFEPTDEQRAKVRALAKLFPPKSNIMIAVQIKGPDGRHISVDTLRRHFEDDLAMGRSEFLTVIATQLAKRALDGPQGLLGDHYVQMQIMARLGGWDGKMEVTGKDGVPLNPGSIDLSRLNDEQLAQYGRLAAIAEGLDPDAIIVEYIDEP